MTTTGNTVAVNGTTLYIERRGGGRPVLLVHGAGEDSTMLASQAESLADGGYSVVTYDRRGTRRSGRDVGPVKVRASTPTTLRHSLVSSAGEHRSLSA